MVEAAADRVAPRGRFRYLLDREGLLGPLMLLPAIVYIVALVGFHFFLAIAYSLSDITVGDQSLDFVGLRNFVDVVQNPTFQKSLKNTFIFTFASQALVLVLANILALALSTNFRGKWVVRFLILLPWTTPVALATIGWLWMLHSVFSPIDWILRAVHLLGPDTLLGPSSNLYWLGRSELAMLSVILVQTWRILPLATGQNSQRDASAADAALVMRPPQLAAGRDALPQTRHVLDGLPLGQLQDDTRGRHAMVAEDRHQVRGMELVGLEGAW